MGVRTRSALSRAPLPYAIRAEADGEPWVPAVDSTFEGAYLSSPLARPTSGDWKAGTLEINAVGAVIGSVMVGPGSAVELAPGTWYEWTRLTDPGTGVQVVDNPGSVIIE